MKPSNTNKYYKVILLLNNLRERSQIKSGMTTLCTTPISRITILRNEERCKGFTLIELLVVVLIIGILSAIALPQYRLAVLKSQFSKLMPQVQAIAQAEKAYYLANGTYEFDDISKLDVIIPGCANNPYGRGYIECDDYSIATDTRLGYNEGDVAGFIINDKRRWYGDLAYTQKLTDGTTYCVASKSSQLAQKVCTSLGGKNPTEHRARINMINNPIYVYSLD